MTNGDRIRQMSDEELAKWLVIVERAIVKKSHEISVIILDEVLIDDWVEWLKEEANDGN